MIRTIFLVFGLLMANLAHAQIAASLDDDGFIVISGSNQPLIGVDFTSGDGLLVPIPDGDASPFDFLLKNDANQVTFGSLPPAFVLVDGDLKLGVGYSGDITGSDLVGSWGTEEFDGAIAFPTAPPTPDPPMDGGGTDPDPVTPPGDPVIPEPSSGLLLLVGLLSAGFIRSSRNGNENA